MPSFPSSVRTLSLSLLLLPFFPSSLRDQGRVAVETILRSTLLSDSPRGVATSEPRSSKIIRSVFRRLLPFLLPPLFSRVYSLLSALAAISPRALDTRARFSSCATCPLLPSYTLDKHVLQGRILRWDERSGTRGKKKIKTGGETLLKGKTEKGLASLTSRERLGWSGLRGNR